MTIEYRNINTIFGGCAQLQVLTYMLNVKQDYLSGIAVGTGLSHSSINRVITPMAQTGMFIETKIGKQIRMFTLNEESPIIQAVMQCFELINDAVTEKVQPETAEIEEPAETAEV